MKAAIYCRVSTEDQEREGPSLQTQLRNVGLDSFRPVREDDPTHHPMHKAYFELDAAATEQINRARRARKRIICVGTTAGYKGSSFEAPG